MVDDLQKATIEAIINIFETGKILGDYGSVTLISGDTGHLTYGRSQTTLASGNLYLLIKDYCEQSGELAAQLTPYLARLKACDVSLDGDAGLRSALRQAGSDPIMQDVQDAFFDRIYWLPSSLSAERFGISCALGYALVYDGHVQGAWRRLAEITSAARGTLQILGERAWLSAYIQQRLTWLQTNQNAVLHATAYRMVAFQGLAAQSKWDLALPITVRGRMITAESLQRPAIRASAESAPPRLLLLETPPLQGDDVGQLQRALSANGVATVQSDVFDQQTSVAVISFQTSKGLKPDGIVGAATRAALGL